MNNQQAFDKMIAHLKTMKHQSISAEDSCLYRSADGGMCAVGCLIKDADYDPSMENKMASIVVGGLKYLEDVTVGLLDDMQEVHDDDCDIFWKSDDGGMRWDVVSKKLKEIAETYKLEYTHNE